MIERLISIWAAMPAALICFATSSTAVADPFLDANTTIFGPNVYVFGPGMPAKDVQATATRIFKKMEANQFGSERYALLFKPGTYDVVFKVGFYTHVAGLGLNPDDVQINGGVNINAKWDDGKALDNFWRTLENFAIIPSSDIPYDTKRGMTRIAVSQASPLRRLHVKGELQLFDWGSKGNVGFASGGFLADSIVDAKVIPASQQQWLSRNSTWAGWNNAVWNMVFVGCENTPPDSFPNPPYTVVDRTPVIREKPYLYMDERGKFFIFVPSLQTNARGVSWAKGSTPGKSVSLDDFYIAQPSTTDATKLNAALAAGKHLLFTPGIYKLDDSLRITKPGTIVFGLGIPSLLPTTGQPAITVADVDGVTIAGLILDAGQPKSPTLLQVGAPGSTGDHAANPTFLYDLSVRTGGAFPGADDVSVQINSNDVVADQIWIWRADHGQNVGWNVNPSKNGLVVNGNRVTIYGLFNEHHEEYQTVWNGNAGRVYMYQSEMPYDVPSQAAWMSGKTEGFASYKVGEAVTSHEAWGLGIYCYFRDEPVKARSAIEGPASPGVKLHHLTTVWLNGKPGSEITHIVNDQGGRVYAGHPEPAMRQTLNEFGGGN